MTETITQLTVPDHHRPCTELPVGSPARFSWTLDDVAAALQISVRHLKTIRDEDPTFPAPRMLGTVPRWAPASIARWLADDLAPSSSATDEDSAPAEASTLPAATGATRRRKPPQVGRRQRPPPRARAAPDRCGMSDKSRRGSVPARIQANNRVAFYPSGLVGVGPRQSHRAGSAEEAESFADAINSLGRGGGPLETHYTEPAFMAMKAFLAHLRKAGGPRGTWAQYRSNWNCWIPKQVALTRCCDLAELHWATVFSAAVENGASVGTLSAIARTLGAFMTFGMHHGYFQSEPLGAARMRRDVVRAAKQAAISRDGDQVTGITIDLCPNGDEISEYATAFELVYPGYGRRLLLLAFHCGARIMELAALRADDLNPDQLTVAIGAQLDRNHPWPATRLPKNHKPRVADLWGIGDDNAHSLLADARTRQGPNAGWLFPPLPGVTNWADKLSHLATEAARACSWKGCWTFHWTRHSYATYSLAPTTRGGYGLELHAVQASLGHADPATTQRTYVQKLPRDAGQLRKVTSRPAGQLV